MKIGAVIIATDSMFRPEEIEKLAKAKRPVLFERSVQAYQRAGIKDIVLVAGRYRNQLEKYLSHYGVTFFQEKDSRREGLVNAIGVGIEYLEKQSDCIFISRIDRPFWNADTLEVLQKETMLVAAPVCKERSGGLVCLKKPCFARVKQSCAETEWEDSNTLVDFLRSTGLHLEIVPVEDEGIYTAANTDEEYEHFRIRYDGRGVYPGVKVRLMNRKAFFGPGTVTLLTQIDRMGSVREACARTGMSYSKGWKLIHNAEDEIGYKIVERMPGGKNGGEAYVTERGKKLLLLFEEYTARMERAADQIYEEIFADSDLF